MQSRPKADLSFDALAAIAGSLGMLERHNSLSELRGARQDSREVFCFVLTAYGI